MTQPPPTAEAAVRRLEERLAALERAALLNDVRNRLAQADADLLRLPQEIAALRSRGFLYRAGWEARLSALAEEWPRLRPGVLNAIESHSARLRPAILSVEESVRRLSALRSSPLSAAEPTLRRVESEIAACEHLVNASADAVQNLFRGFLTNLEALSREVADISRMMGWLAEARFVLQPGEGLVEAVQARFLRGDERQEGILFLTDQRLIFERREKVARKKVLFITTASETIQEVVWEAPLAQVGEVNAAEARRALVLKRELLAISPAPGGPFGRAELELDADSETWRALILRCQTGEVAQDRAGGAPEVPVFIIPPKCPSCGAALDRAGPVRGLSSIRCEYCGTTIPLQRA